MDPHLCLIFETKILEMVEAFLFIAKIVKETRDLKHPKSGSLFCILTQNCGRFVSFYSSLHALQCLLVCYVVVVTINLKTHTHTQLVSVPYSCMDTSSKTWLPHQSQFGLVGQAEVCCGGPGVLTPSESTQPHAAGLISYFLSAVRLRPRLQSVMVRYRLSLFSLFLYVPLQSALSSEIH